MLSSVTKSITPGVWELIQLSYEDNFPSGNYRGQVGFAPFHDLDNEVPPDVKEQLETLRIALTDGSIQTNVPVRKP
jgi:basic membrane protein A